MEKITSFTVDHLHLQPGIYESRIDWIKEIPIKTYDLRVTTPNYEPVLNTAEIHTIEHLAATYMRNHPQYKDDVIYFGPMGCRTGFYFIFKGNHDNETVFKFIYDTFEFIANYTGDIPGAQAKDCGNYLDHNLPMAKYVANKYLEVLKGLENKQFQY